MVIQSVVVLNNLFLIIMKRWMKHIGCVAIRTKKFIHIVQFGCQVFLKMGISFIQNVVSKIQEKRWIVIMEDICCVVKTVLIMKLIHQKVLQQVGFMEDALRIKRINGEYASKKPLFRGFLLFKLITSGKAYGRDFSYLSSFPYPT